MGRYATGNYAKLSREHPPGRSTGAGWPAQTEIHAPFQDHSLCTNGSPPHAVEALLAYTNPAHGTATEAEVQSPSCSRPRMASIKVLAQRRPKKIAQLPIIYAFISPLVRCECPGTSWQHIIAYYVVSLRARRMARHDQR